MYMFSQLKRKKRKDKKELPALEVSALTKRFFRYQDKETPCTIHPNV